jgi:glutathione S-transferase
VAELVVHHLPGAWGLPSVSPFCLKLDVYLRLAGVPHRSVVDATPFGAPKGKLPYIEHDGKKIGDSGFIIDYLVERRIGNDPNARLTPAERGIALALRRLIEENLYWVMVYDRWVVEENWHRMRPVIFAGVPAPLRPIVAPIARRGVKRQLKGHGIGLHSRDEIHAIGGRDVGALADFLGDKPFLMGDTPTEIDAVAYAQLANIMHVPIESPVQNGALTRPNLVAYVERMRRRVFG